MCYDNCSTAQLLDPGLTVYRIQGLGFFLVCTTQRLGFRASYLGLEPGTLTIWGSGARGLGFSPLPRLRLFRRRGARRGKGVHRSPTEACSDFDGVWVRVSRVYNRVWGFRGLPGHPKNVLAFSSYRPSD